MRIIKIVLGICMLQLVSNVGYTQDEQEYGVFQIRDSANSLLKEEGGEVKAMKLYLKHLRNQERIPIVERAWLHYCYANLLNWTGKKDECIEQYREGLRLMPQSSEAYGQIKQFTYHSMTLVYFDLQKTDSCRRYLILLNADNTKIPIRNMSFIKNIEAHFEYEDGNYARAERVYLESLGTQKKHETTYCESSTTMVKLMQVYGKQKNIDSVNKIFNEIITLCKECNLPKNEYYARYIRSEIALETQENRLAFDEYKIARTMEDSLKAISDRKILDDLDKRYQTDLKDETIRSQKEREENILKAQELRDKLTTGIFVGLGTVLLVIVFFLRRTLKQRRELDAQKMKIEKNLDEKQLLLKEIHHRVKNNFQIVSSLLELQTKGIEDEKALELAMEGQNRVKSMALIHQKLYQNDNLLIDFEDYSKQLVGEIQRLYANRKVKTTFEIEEKISLDIDTAIPLGLILNELITNAFKYGYIKEDENELIVKMEKHINSYTMIVSDSGKGIPEEVNLKSTKSLGLRLVRRLSKQLGGSFSYKYKNGAEFEILFQDTEMRMLQS